MFQVFLMLLFLFGLLFLCLLFLCPSLHHLLIVANKGSLPLQLILFRINRWDAFWVFIPPIFFQIIQYVTFLGLTLRFGVVHFLECHEVIRILKNRTKLTATA